MKELLAKNPKQLDICLKLLYAEHVKFSVEVTETATKKIVYLVSAYGLDKLAENVLEEKYHILIS